MLFFVWRRTVISRRELQKERRVDQTAKRQSLTLLWKSIKNERDNI